MSQNNTTSQVYSYTHTRKALPILGNILYLAQFGQFSAQISPMNPAHFSQHRGSPILANIPYFAQFSQHILSQV